MSLKFIFLITITTSTIFLTACPSSENSLTANNGNINSANANKMVANSNNTFTPTKPVEVPTTNNAPTLAPVVQAYYDALKNKDDAAIRKVLSAEFVKTLEADMKEEKKTSLTAFIAELDKVPEKPIEVRNEKIEGDKGVAEIKGGTYVNWTPIAFVKEGGAWKMSNDSPDIQTVQQSANSNASSNKAK